MKVSGLYNRSVLLKCRQNGNAVSFFAGVLTFLFLFLSVGPAFPDETEIGTNTNRIFKAAARGDLEAVRYCVETLKLPINAEADYILRETPLMYAAESGNVELVKYMVAHGADPEACTDCDEGYTNVAMYAIRSKNLEMVRYFIEELEQTPSSGYWSPMAIAVATQKPEIVEYLFQKGGGLLPSSVNLYDCAILGGGFQTWINRVKWYGMESLKTGRTESSNSFGPITEQNRDPKIVQILLNHGASVLPVHLYWAIQSQQVEIIRLLLDKSLPTMLADDYRRGTIRAYNSWRRLARETGNSEVYALFLERDDYVAKNFQPVYDDDEIGDEGFPISFESLNLSSISGNSFKCYTGYDYYSVPWLTFPRSDAKSVIVSWLSKNETTAVLCYGTDRKCTQRITCSERSERHRVEIPIPDGTPVMYYRIESTDEKGNAIRTQVYPFKTCRGTEELRVLVVGTWGGSGLCAPPEIMESIDLILPLGKYLSESLIDRFPNDAPPQDLRPIFDNWCRNCFWQYFRATTITMPTLGDSDRQILPSTTKRPENIYDMDAQAYLETFPLPVPGRYWYIDLPDFSVRFVSLDVSNADQIGTKFQSCRDWRADSEMCRWYQNLMSRSFDRDFTVTLLHESPDFRNLENGLWGKLFARGTCTISDSSDSFAQRIECSNGTGVYYSTSLRPENGWTAKWKTEQGVRDEFDPDADFRFSGGNYMILSFPKGRVMNAEIYSLEGRVLKDSQTFQP